jgi:uncharacterized membrane protein HdeD (DUF308 family)
MESVIYVGARAQPRQSLWAQLTAGATAIGFGLFLLAYPSAASSELPHIAALLWLTFGLINALESVLYQPRARWWYLAAGLLGILAGMLMIGAPLLAPSTPTVVLYVCAVMLALVSGAIQLAASVRTGLDVGHLLMGLLQVSLAAVVPVFPVSAPAIGVQFFVALVAIAIGAALLFVRWTR